MVPQLYRGGHPVDFWLRRLLAGLVLVLVLVEVAESARRPRRCRRMAAIGGTGGLPESEQQVWKAFATGSLLDFGTRDAAEDDPVAGDGWGPSLFGAVGLIAFVLAIVDVGILR